MATTAAMHSYKEVLTDCTHCKTEGTLKKILSVPFYGVKKISDTKQPVGAITKEHIESNKEALEELKKQSESEAYEPS